MNAKIKEKNEVAKNTLEVKFDLLGKKVDFKAGQYFFVTLLNAPVKDNGKDPIHHFTISSSPNGKEVLALTTRIRNTPFKQSLVKMPVGSEVEVGNTGGDFILPDDISKPLVFIALGIGITPYMSMLRYIKEEFLSYKVTLFYSDSELESLAYFKELEKYEKENPNFKMIAVITKDPNWQGEKRHIDGGVIEDYLKNPNEYIYYISGPPKIVETVAASLAKAGIERENINTDNFTGY